MSATLRSQRAFQELLDGAFGGEGMDLATRWNRNVNRAKASVGQPWESSEFVRRMKAHPLSATVEPGQWKMVKSEDPAEKLAILRDLVPIAEHLVSECLPGRVECSACDGRGYHETPPAFNPDGAK